MAKPNNEPTAPTALRVMATEKCFIEGARRYTGEDFIWHNPPDPLPKCVVAYVEPVGEVEAAGDPPPPDMLS